MFNSFGSFGPCFTMAERHIRAQFEAGWREMKGRTDPTLPDLEQALAMFDPTAFWVGPFLGLRDHFHVPENTMRSRWNDFRSLFRPQLGQLEAMLGDPHRRKVCGAIARLESLLHQNTVADSLRSVTRLVCFGPYDELQMEYIARHHPAVVEMAAGSGYLIRTLRQRGVDAVGIESNAYDFGTDDRQNRQGVLDMFEWTAALITAGHLIRGSVERLPDLAKDRTLLLSWPEPGSRFPVEALEAYRAAGGKRLLFKLGGFIGVLSRGGTQPVDTTNYRRTGTNCEAFFEALNRHWGPPSGPAPPYQPLMFFNNLWAFELRG